MKWKQVFHYGTTSAGLLILSCTIIKLIAELVQYAQGSPASFTDVPRAEPNQVFFDLRILSHNGSGCDISIAEISPERHCATDLYPFNYPTFGLWIVRLIGIGADSTRDFGVALGATTIALVTVFFLQRFKEALPNKVAGFFVFICLILGLNSFAFRYALERGQVDLLILDLVLLPLVFPVPRRELIGEITKGHIGIYLGLIVSSLIKIFTFPALVGISVLETLALNKRRIATILLLWTATILCGISLVHPVEISRAINISGLGGHGFGLSVLLNAGYLTDATSGLSLKFLFLGIGFALFSSTILVKLRSLIFQHRRQPIKFLKAMGISFGELRCSELYIIISTMIAVPLYIATENINYKWIFLLPTIGSLVVLASKTSVASNKVKLCYLIVTLALSQAFLSYPYSPTTYVYLEWLAHFAMHPFVIGGLCSLSLNLIVNNREYVERHH